MLRIGLHEANMAAMREAFRSAFKKAGTTSSLNTHHLYRVALDLVGLEKDDIEIVAQCTEVINNLLEDGGLEDNELAVLIQECSDAVTKCRDACKADEAAKNI